MALQTIFAYWLLSFSITIIPGADWAYLISAGAKHRVMAALTGMLIGYFIIILAVALGLGSIIAQYPWLLFSLTIIGAIYLAWLGIQAVYYAKKDSHAQQHSSIAWQSWCYKGIAVSGLNPKVLLTFIALLPQFVNLQLNWSLFEQIMLLGIVHMLNCAFIYPFVGVGTGLLLQRKPQYSYWLSRASGVAMISIAVGLFMQSLA